MTRSVTVDVILAAAERRGWTTRLVTSDPDIYALGVPGKAPYFVKNPSSYRGPGVNGFITKSKEVLYKIVGDAGIAHLPETVELNGSTTEAEQLLERLGKVVVKPTDESHGNGVTVGIETVEALHRAIEYAQTYGEKIIVQQHVEGDDYRLLYIDGKFVAATMRKPAAVVGNGTSTIRELIDEENARDTLSDGRPKAPNRIINVAAAELYLGDDINSVPINGVEVRVAGPANISAGGSAIDATDDILPEAVKNGTDLLAYLRLEFGGVDFIIDQGIPYLLEINVAPSFDLHSYPTFGTPRNVADVYLDWLDK